MNRILVGAFIFVVLTASVFAEVKGPEIQIVDGKVTIRAESVTLAQFLHLLDAATGMNSKVPQEFANQKISVRLDGLELSAAIRKSFQGQPWNYGIVEGKGITIFDRAQSIVPSIGGGVSSPIQTIANDTRSEPAPLPVLNASPFPPPTPIPTPANGNAAGQPAGAVNLPPAQGGAPAITPLFQPIGGSLSAPLPTAQPNSR